MKSATGVRRRVATLAPNTPARQGPRLTGSSHRSPGASGQAKHIMRHGQESLTSFVDPHGYYVGPHERFDEFFIFMIDRFHHSQSSR